MNKLSTACILIAGILWGTMGIFVRALESYGFSPMQVTCIRLSITAIILISFLAVSDRGKLRIKLKDLGWFIALGIGSLLITSFLYFTTITLTSLSVAAILMYTSPIFVMVMSVCFFREVFTYRKLVALVFAFVGCFLVAGIGSGHTITAGGFLLGLTSGFTYALYSIFGTVLLKKYHPYTVTVYGFSFATLGAFVVSDVPSMLNIISSTASAQRPELILLIVTTGFLTAFAPFLLYTIGLKEVNASKAAIMACIEPMIATIISFLYFKEAISFMSLTGILLIISSIIITNTVPKYKSLQSKSL